MDIREFYEVTGSDYKGTLGNLKTEDRLVKFAKMFLQEPSFSECEKSIIAQDIQSSFRGAHTIKGLCLTMGFTKLLQSSSALTENLRDGTFKSDSLDLFNAMKEDYNFLIEQLKKLD